MTLIDYVYYIGLLVYGLDLLGAGNYIILAWVILLAVLRKSDTYYVSRQAWLLFLFGVLYIMFSSLYESIELQTIIRVLLAPFFGYLMSENYYIQGGNIKTGILILVIGMFLHGSLNMIVTLRSGYTVGRITNFWGGELAQTLQGMILTPAAALFYFGIHNFKNHKASILVSIMAGLSLYFSIVTGRRTLVYIFLALIAINLVRSVFVNNSTKYLMRLIFTFSVILIVCIVAYLSDFRGIRTYIEASTFYQRSFVVDESELGASRSQIHGYVISHILDYLFGGSAPIPYASFAHNLWLDVLVVAGIFPMIVLIAYSISTILTLKRFMQNDEIDESCKVAYFSIFFALILSFYVEPVLLGAPHSFIAMCIMNGMAHAVSVRAEQNLMIDQEYNYQWMGYI